MNSLEINDLHKVCRKILSGCLAIKEFVVFNMIYY